MVQITNQQQIIVTIKGGAAEYCDILKALTYAISSCENAHHRFSINHVLQSMLPTEFMLDENSTINNSSKEHYTHANGKAPASASESRHN